MTIRHQGKVISRFRLVAFGIPKVVKETGGVFEIELHPSKSNPRLDYVIKRFFEVNGRNKSKTLYGADINRDPDCLASRIVWEDKPFSVSKERR